MSRAKQRAGSTYNGKTSQRAEMRTSLEEHLDEGVAEPHLLYGGPEAGAQVWSQSALTLTQRRHLLSQISRLQGNQYLQRMLAQRHPAPGLIIQRRNLSSPRFAGDPTLEQIYNQSGTLKVGSNGDPVRKVQHAIHDAGILFLGHGVDGKFGRETRRRVSSFQHQHGITADPAGEVGAATVEKLDQLFPQVALPASATSAYTFDGMLELLCQWNSAMIRDLRNLHVEMVGGLEWADEEFDGTNWVPKPMPGAGETSGTNIIIATNNTNEEVAKTLYHEYQHARSPYAYRSRSWAEEETRAFAMETYWAIDRGITPDPSLTTTDPTTGQVEIDPSGVDATVSNYPGLDGNNPGEVIGKVGTNRVRVRMPNGTVTVRNAVRGDSIPGPRQVIPPRHRVTPAEWRC